MSYFCKVEYRPESGADVRALAGLYDNPYLQHQKLWTLFDLPPDAARPFVFHHQLSAKSFPAFWVISKLPLRSDLEAWKVQQKPYQPKFELGQILAFELRANPVVRRKGVTDGKWRRYDPVALKLKQLPQNEHAQERNEWVLHKLTEWLADRTAAFGFKIDVDKTVVARYEQVKFSKTRGAQPIQFSIADFNGQLTVTDVARFTDVAHQGFGAAKGFGCGALLLRPVRKLLDDDE